jgi:hypothetical protein
MGTCVSTLRKCPNREGTIQYRKRHGDGDNQVGVVEACGRRRRGSKSKPSARPCKQCLFAVLLAGFPCRNATHYDPRLVHQVRLFIEQTTPSGARFLTRKSRFLCFCAPRCTPALHAYSNSRLGHVIAVVELAPTNDMEQRICVKCNVPWISQLTIAVARLDHQKDSTTQPSRPDVWKSHPAQSGPSLAGYPLTHVWELRAEAREGNTISRTA